MLSVKGMDLYFRRVYILWLLFAFIQIRKAEYLDALVESNLLTNFWGTAKELQVKERKFIDWLQENRYIYRDAKGVLRPYAQHVLKLFEMKEWERNRKSGVRTLITTHGREKHFGYY